jgi:hypothetical protein
VTADTKTLGKFITEIDNTKPEIVFAHFPATRIGAIPGPYEM